jgi:hypothetical protein
MKSLSLLHALAAAAALIGCAAPTDANKPQDIAEIRDCPTGTRVCRKDGDMGDVRTMSAEAARDAIGRMTPAPNSKGN